MTGLNPSLHRIPLALTPEEVALRLRGREGLVFLDTSGHATEGGAVSFVTAEPREWLRGSIHELAPLREALARLPGAAGSGARGMPHGGLFGAVGFDGQYAFGLYDQVMMFRHDTEEWWETGGLSRSIPVQSVVEGEVPALDFKPLLGREEFCAMVRRALEYIAAGDIYQVNLSRPWEAAWPDGADPFALYQRLRHFSPAPHGAFLDLGDRQILSASPESFLRMSGSLVRTRPIKGTRPRRRDPQEDEKSAYDLITSPKEISELIMITDLERNDLGRVCEYGSVSVPELLKLERFEQVFHLVSTVQGTLRSGVDHAAALQACFPGGSISGAPKKRACEIIRELERFPRGLYTGALGFLGAGGESHFSIAIRTAVVEKGRIHFHTGAGIVADSDPGQEDEETWHKAATLLGAARWRTGTAGAEKKPAPAGPERV